MKATTKTCQWGQCDAEATLSLSGYAPSSTVRAIEWYCEDCYPHRVAELTERAMTYDTTHDDVKVALDVHIDRIGVEAEACTVYDDDDGPTARVTISDGDHSVTLTGVRAVRVLAALDPQTDADAVWSALAEASAAGHK